MDSQRGQTTLDFAIGVAVFLAVILFTFTFVPGILTPFDLTGEEEPAVSNQIADSLAHDKLGSPESPHSLDRYCTVEFFNESRESPPDDCSYTSLDPAEQFDLSRTQRVHVRLIADLDGNGDRTGLCWKPEGADIDLDDPDWGLKEGGNCGGDGVALSTGDDLPDGGVSTITARRVVQFQDRAVMMEVVVW